MKTTTLCLSALLLFPACERKLPDVDPAGASVAAGAPILAMELELDGPQFRDHEDGHDDEDPADALPIGSDSPAACMAWTTRKKAKIESWMPRYVECVLKKGAEAGIIGPPVEGEANYYYLQIEEAGLQGVNGNEFWIGGGLTFAVRQEGGAVIGSICAPEEPEHMRITIEEEGNGHVISLVGSQISVAEQSESERDKVSVCEVVFDNTAPGEERYDFVCHQSLERCDGPDPFADSGESNEACFYRTEGAMVNYTEGLVSSVMMGMDVSSEFGNPTSYRHTTVFDATDGITRYALGEGTLDPDEEVLEKWAVTDFTIGDNYAAFTEDDPVTDALLETLLASTLYERQTTRPGLTSSYVCPTDPEIYDIDITVIPGIEDCPNDPLRLPPPDTVCSAESAPGVNEEFLCDDNDPLTTCP